MNTTAEVEYDQVYRNTVKSRTKPFLVSRD